MDDVRSPSCVKGLRRFRRSMKNDYPSRRNVNSPEGRKNDAVGKYFLRTDMPAAVAFSERNLDSTPFERRDRIKKIA